jgi:2-phospho-L-lactate transferase/gluconeogenesis factor (CofD/UPF0052 family)
MKIALFAGGRGSASIIGSLVLRKELQVTVLINAYDDGKSTGAIRSAFPGILGPSDFRKNLSTIISTQGPYGKQCAEFLEYRIKAFANSAIDWTTSQPDSKERFFDYWTENLIGLHIQNAKKWIYMALTHLEQESTSNSNDLLSDMSVGNLLIAGAYIDSDFSFNRAIDRVQQVFSVSPHKVVNVTDGSNLFLMARKVDNELLFNESSIVDIQSAEPIQRIYLLDESPNSEMILYLQAMEAQLQEQWLEDNCRIPNLSDQAKTAIEEADLIVYGPGTQHSSLFPSYMTLGLAELIASRASVEKIFIGNLNADNDIQSESIPSIIEKLSFYMNLATINRVQTSDLVSHGFINSNDVSTTPWGVDTTSIKSNAVGLHYAQWSKDGAVHDGERIANGLLSTGFQNSFPRNSGPYITVSLVIPVLNEVKTLPLVLHEILTFDWLRHQIIPEVVVVDGGSTDGSASVLNNYPTIRKIYMESCAGRGAALTAGIRSATSEYIITFPSDNEYSPSDIPMIVSLLNNERYSIIFGSRTGRADSINRLREIYGGRTKEYYLSLIGGQLLSLVSGILYRKWISDTLTSIKAFNRKTAGSLSFDGNQVDWDMNIIRDSFKLGIGIAEVPVRFSPRNLSSGKKIRPKHGLKALIALISGRFR